MAWMILIGSLVLMSKAIYEIITLRKRAQHILSRSRVRFFVIDGRLFLIDHESKLRLNVLAINPSNPPDTGNRHTDWRLL